MCRKSPKKYQKNLKFSSASVIYKLIVKSENRVSGNDEDCHIRLFDEFDHVVGSVFSHFVRVRRGPGRSVFQGNPVKCSEIRSLFHLIFTSSGQQFSQQSPANLATGNKHNSVQNGGLISQCTLRRISPNVSVPLREIIMMISPMVSDCCAKSISLRV